MAKAAAKESGGKPVLDHLYLVDGSGYIFRAFHAIPVHSFVRSDGIHTNAVNGFCNMILKLLAEAALDDHQEVVPDGLAVIFDAKRENFRNDIYPDYKANRDEPPEELRPQFELIKEATRAFNLPCIEMEGYEADDLIATYARQAEAAGVKVTIVSSDKDLMQLVRGGVAMMDPMKGMRIGPDEVFEKFGVAPEKVVDVQALAGDSTDNVPGVPGIGVKTAAQLIQEYGDLDTLLARAEEIKQPKRRENLIEHAEMARISRELVRLKDDVETDTGLETMALKSPDPETVLNFLRAQEFRTLTARVEQQLADDGLIETPVAAAAEVPEGDADYTLVQDMAALEGWIAAARDAGVVAVDTETTSLNAMRAELVGVSLSVEPGKACYIPVGHKGAAPEGELDLGGDDDKAPEQISRDDALKALKDLFEDPAVLKVGQNLKYDILVLRKYGVTIAPVDDTMLLSFVTAAGLRGHGMDALSKELLDHETIKYSEVAGTGKKQVTFDRVPLDAARDYAAEDADITGRLYGLLKPQLAANHLVTVYETLERPLIPVLVEMEAAGIRVDRDVLVGLSKDFEKRAAKLEGEIHKLAGGEFNVGSPKQLGEVLFDQMGLPGGKKGKTGAYTTGADVLEDLAAQGHDLPVKMLEWRQLTKLKSTYTDALVEQINPDTGRVHTSYAMAGAATGRLASSDPNLQNIPVRTEEGRRIREAFIAADGCKLVSLDYSQIELRLLAHVAGIDTLRQAFADGLDIHAMTASEVFGVPIEGMDPMVRRQAKAINFGIIYGISAFGLARNLGTSKSEAQQFIDAYFERFPGIKDYMDRTKGFAHENGYVETPFGRRLHTPGLKDKNQARRSFAERAAINAPLQGGAADIIKRAMIRVPDVLAKKKLSATMLLQVHDELLFDVPEDEIDDTIAAVKNVMEAAARPAVELAVPLVVDAGIGTTWSEAH